TGAEGYEPGRGDDLARPPAARSICDLMGSAAVSVTFVDSARTSRACAVNTPNCLRQKAACSSTMSARSLAPARLVAKSKLASTLRRARSTILRLKAAAPWPAASKDLSNVVKGAHSVWNGGVETEETELDRRVAVFAAGLIGCGLGTVGRVHYLYLLASGWWRRSGRLG